MPLVIISATRRPGAVTSVIEDKNQFSHEEQELIKADLRAIKVKLGIEENAKGG